MQPEALFRKRGSRLAEVKVVQLKHGHRAALKRAVEREIILGAVCVTVLVHTSALNIAHPRPLRKGHDQLKLAPRYDVALRKRRLGATSLDLELLAIEEEAETWVLHLRSCKLLLDPTPEFAYRPSRGQIFWKRNDILLTCDGQHVHVAAGSLSLAALEFGCRVDSHQLPFYLRPRVLQQLWPAFHPLVDQAREARPALVWLQLVHAVLTQESLHGVHRLWEWIVASQLDRLAARAADAGRQQLGAMGSHRVQAREREKPRRPSSSARLHATQHTGLVRSIGRSRRRPRLFQAAPLREHACTRGGCLCSHPITPARGGGRGVLNNLASPRGAKRRWPKHHFRSARVRLPPTISKPWPPAHWRRCTGVELARMGYHASSHLFPPLTGGAHSPRARLTACADARDFPRPTSMGILSAKSYLLTTAHERSRLSRCRRTTLNQLSLY